MDPDQPTVPLARRVMLLLEPVHSAVYFAPECSDRYRDLGLDFMSGYFCSRSAPMGRCAPETVAAAFGVFSPAMVRAAVSAGWRVTDAETVLAARHDGVTAALKRFGAADVDLDLATKLVESAIAPVRDLVAGRPLYGGHAALPAPKDRVLRLWHAVTLWREFRGDGHILAWTSAGLDPVEAVVLYELWIGVPPGAWVPMRGYSPADQAAAVARLADRGLISADGQRFTARGRDLRAAIEAHTDTLSALPAATLGEDGLATLTELLAPLRDAIVGGGGFPVPAGTDPEAAGRSFDLAEPATTSADDDVLAGLDFDPESDDDEPLEDW